MRRLQSLEPCQTWGRNGVRAQKNGEFNGCGRQIRSGGVPAGLVAPRPSTEGWLCRSRLPAGGSTRPRRRCSLAGLRAGRRQLLLGPEGPLDLEGKTTQKPLVHRPLLRVVTSPLCSRSLFTLNGNRSFTYCNNRAVSTRFSSRPLKFDVKRSICEKGNEPSTTLCGWQVRNLLPLCWVAGKAAAPLKKAAGGAQPPFSSDGHQKSE